MTSDGGSREDREASLTDEVADPPEDFLGAGDEDLAWRRS
jgi:hypothetical protein